MINKKSVAQANKDRDLQKPFLDFLLKELQENNKTIIYNFGTFEKIPSRKGSHWDIRAKKNVKAKRKYRIKFRPATKLKEWLR
jgi:nucleoid DNA-binding protein